MHYVHSVYQGKRLPAVHLWRLFPCLLWAVRPRRGTRGLEGLLPRAARRGIRPLADAALPLLAARRHRAALTARAETQHIPQVT